MVSTGELLGMVVFVGIQTAIAALGTRFFRVLVRGRIVTAVFVVVAVPTVLLGTTLLFSGVVALGIDLQEPFVAVLVSIVFPFIVGVTIDFVWVASPAEVAAELED